MNEEGLAFILGADDDSCPKCTQKSGDDWSQCPKNYGCPMSASPWHYSKKPESEKTARELLYDIIKRRAIPCEYYHDYYFMDGKVQDDCPNIEELLKIIQDLSRGIGEDISTVLDKLPEDG